MSRRLIFVLGGTRSGKSRYGLARAAAFAGGGVAAFLATALPGDPELEKRIAGHRRQRPVSWPTIEVGTDLAAAIRAADPSLPILLDGLTLWASALVAAEQPTIDDVLSGPFAAAMEAIRARSGEVVVVSDEIGLGLVPMDAAARDFRDLLGILHQRLAAEADEVYFMIAGLPITVRVSDG
jgi:adenosylcobinamide kinase/adenosylcobinamide-phosphate guanylyltransferase